MDVAMIPWLAKFETDAPDPRFEKNLLLKGQLLEELPGILNWALEGLAAYLQDGLDIPAVVKAATDEYRAESDVIGQFLADCCKLEQGQVAQANELYRAYQGWCGANGVKYVLAQNVFGGKLKTKGLESARNKSGNVWRGIGVVFVPTPDRSEFSGRSDYEAPAERQYTPPACDDFPSEDEINAELQAGGAKMRHG